MSLREKLEERLLSFVIGIVAGTLALWLTLIQLLGLSVMRREDYVERSELSQNYISRSELSENWISKETLQNNYILKSQVSNCNTPIGNSQDSPAGRHAAVTSVPGITQAIIPSGAVTSSHPTSDGEESSVKSAGSEYSPSSAPKILRTVEEEEFRFDLYRCKFHGSSVACEMLITNQIADRALHLSRPYATALSRIIDDAGNEWPASEFVLGVQTGEAVEEIMPQGVPVRAVITFKGVASEASSIRLLEVGCYARFAKGNGNSAMFVTKIADIPLSRQ